MFIVSKHFQMKCTNRETAFLAAKSANATWDSQARVI